MRPGIGEVRPTGDLHAAGGLCPHFRHCQRSVQGSQPVESRLHLGFL